MPRERHSINGVFQGVFYDTPDGHKVYLAHRRREQIHREKNAWLMPMSLLQKCRERGVEAVGVLRKEGTKRLIWLTPVEDFFTSPHAFSYYKDGMRCLGLPLPQFRIDPALREDRIAKAVKLGR